MGSFFIFRFFLTYLAEKYRIVACAIFFAALGPIPVIMLPETSKWTNIPETNAWMALICYHSSRLESRISVDGEILSLEDQDRNFWSSELISKGNYFLSKSIGEFEMGEYQIQALIAWNHTLEDSNEKWERMLELYNKLLSIRYNPIVIMNRAYVLSKCGRDEEAIHELNLKIEDKNNYQFHLIIANIYKKLNFHLAKSHFELAIAYCPSNSGKILIQKTMNKFFIYSKL